MKKQKKLRASGALVIFAVLFLLSACGVFTPYDPPVTAHFLINDYDTIQLTITEGSKEINVTLIKSSKIQDLHVKWEFEDPDTRMANISIKTENGTELSSPWSIQRTTNFILTLTPLHTGSINYFYIEVYNDDDPTKFLALCQIPIIVNP